MYMCCIAAYMPMCICYMAAMYMCCIAAYMPMRICYMHICHIATYMPMHSDMSHCYMHSHLHMLHIHTLHGCIHGHMSHCYKHSHAPTATSTKSSCIHVKIIIIFITNHMILAYVYHHMDNNNNNNYNQISRIQALTTLDLHNNNWSTVSSYSTVSQ